MGKHVSCDVNNIAGVGSRGKMISRELDSSIAEAKAKVGAEPQV